MLLSCIGADIIKFCLEVLHLVVMLFIYMKDRIVVATTSFYFFIPTSNYLVTWTYFHPIFYVYRNQVANFDLYRTLLDTCKGVDSWLKTGKFTKYFLLYSLVLTI